MKLNPLLKVQGPIFKIDFFVSFVESTLKRSKFRISV